MLCMNAPLINIHGPVDWQAIDTVLLDMDGTLLDLQFDNWFWQVHIPTRYGLLHGLSFEAAVQQLKPGFLAVQGTLDWYCIDYWSRQLGLDISSLKHEVRERVAFLPGATAFLARLKELGKRRILVTNAHPQTLAIKDGHVSLSPWLDEVHSSHQYGLPKEAADFWPRLRRQVPFDPQRTLFVDDSLPVLLAAQGYGIRWLRAVSRPDLSLPVRDTGEIPGVESVAHLFDATGAPLADSLPSEQLSP